MTSAEGAIHRKIRSQMRTESRFQRWFLYDLNSWGDAPSFGNTAPLALNRELPSGRRDDFCNLREDLSASSLGNAAIGLGSHNLFHRARQYFFHPVQRRIRDCSRTGRFARRRESDVPDYVRA
jgi:hypothetical protein